MGGGGSIRVSPTIPYKYSNISPRVAVDLEFSLVSINKFEREVSAGSLLHCRLCGSTSAIAASFLIV